MADQIRGRALLLGDDINTDLNCSGKYMPGKDEAFIAAHAFTPVAPDFATRFKAGDMLVAGKHFGINSSREQATHILKRMGVAAIIAKSFGRQFYRNAINNGLMVIECDTTGLQEGDALLLDLQAHRLSVQDGDWQQALSPLPAAIRAILSEGGLIPFLKKYPTWELPA